MHRVLCKIQVITYLLIFRFRAEPSTHSLKDFGPPEQIEGHLPEHGIDGILDKPRNFHPERVAMQVAYPQVPLDNMTKL